MGLTRHSDDLSLALTNSATTTAVLDFRGWICGRVMIPVGSSITSLTWYESDDVGGTYVAAYDDSSPPAAVTQTVSAGKGYPIPTILAGARALKIVADASGNVTVSLKG